MTAELFLLTASYPFGTGEEFLDYELPYLVAAYGRVVIVPQHVAGPERTVPASVEVDRDMARRLDARVRAAALIVRHPRVAAALLRELWGQRRSLTVRRLRMMLFFAMRAAAAECWARRLRRRLRPGTEVVIYTYWLGPEGWATRRGLGAGVRSVVVSRAHRGDLYEAAAPGGYLPLRDESLRSLDAVFCVSDHGRRYLLERHAAPLRDVCVEVARLGTDAPGFSSPASPRPGFRLVSCSAMVPVKRVDRVATAACSFAADHAELDVTWTHAGDGPCRPAVEAALVAAPVNLRVELLGHVSHESAIDAYRRPSDVFVNLSASEGVPVSIMEAISCGVPVVATDVGGTSEIVDTTYAVLLPEDPALRQVVDGLATFLEPEGHVMERRRRALAIWHQRCDATVNLAAFAQRLTALHADGATLIGADPPEDPSQ